MPSRYAQWMYDWEHRLTSVDNNRVVRPLEWGVEWARDWPCRNGFRPASRSRRRSREILRRIQPAHRRVPAMNFIPTSSPRISVWSGARCRFSARAKFPTPSSKRKCKGTFAEFLRFTSPVHTPYPENNLVNARWFPAPRARGGRSCCRTGMPTRSPTSSVPGAELLGIAVLRLSMPYHDIRMPAEISRADYAVSANIGRTLDACRQGVIDMRCCLDWLEQQGYSELGIVGTSLGSCYAFLAAAHDPRIRVAAFNHASTYVADVVWHGQSTRHIRAGPGIEDRSGAPAAGLAAISPMSYFEQFARWPKKSLIIYAKYDLTFLPEFSRRWWKSSSGTAWTTKSWCCPAATTRPAKRHSNTWTAGSWRRFSARRLKARLLRTSHRIANCWPLNVMRHRICLSPEHSRSYPADGEYIIST